MSASPYAKKPLVRDEGKDMETSPDASLSSCLVEPPPKYEDTVGSESACSDALLQKHSNGDAVQIDIPLENMEEEKVKVVDSEDSLTTDSDLSSSGVSCPNPMICVESLQRGTRTFCKNHKSYFKYILGAIGLALYIAFYIWAVVTDYKRASALIVITKLILVYGAYKLIQLKLGKRIQRNVFKPVSNFTTRYWRYLKWVVYVGLVVALIMYMAIFVKPQPHQLISLLGLTSFLLILALTSKHPSKVRVRPVIWGLGMQFVLGILILRTQMGYDFFHYLAKEIQKFLSFSDAGAEFVFGSAYAEHFFAFKVLPVVVYFSCTIAVLYYLGVMQFIIGKIAWVMQITMGTAATESLIAAGNIFIGQTEAPILVRPFIKDMTLSELHAMMTAGFATIAGGVLAAYILFGVPAEHLLCASVMNAPVALAVSKLSYPETEPSTEVEEQIKLEKGKERNMLEAASAGASASIKLVANIAVNLIAFIALLAFVNAALSWFGSLVDHPEFNFLVLCSYLFMPIAFLMGVDWADCMDVAKLLGMKTFINEFVAYEELSKYIKNRKECLDGPTISIRSEIISTYALCGFANLSSIGIQLGGIGPMAPERRSDLATLAFRALACGITACFITASVAGLLTVEEPFEGCMNATAVLNTTLLNNVTYGDAAKFTGVTGVTSLPTTS